MFGLRRRVCFRQRRPLALWREMVRVCPRVSSLESGGPRVSPFQSFLSASPRASPVTVLAGPEGIAAEAPPRTAGRTTDAVLRSAAMAMRRHRSQDGICGAKDLARKSCYYCPISRMRNRGREVTVDRRPRPPGAQFVLPQQALHPCVTCLSPSLHLPEARV